MNAKDFELQEFWAVRVRTVDDKYIPASLDFDDNTSQELDVCTSRKIARELAEECKHSSGVKSAIPVKAVVISKYTYDRMLAELERLRKQTGE